MRLLAELPRPLATAIRRAALGITKVDGRWIRRRTWRSVRARTTAAIGWALYSQSRASSRPGFVRVLAGVSVRMIGALFTKADGLCGYSRSWIGATHAGRNGHERGPLAALRDAGAFDVVQPPASVTPAHAGPPRRGADGVARRYAFNQYRWAWHSIDPDGWGESFELADEAARLSGWNGEQAPGATDPPLPA